MNDAEGLSEGLGLMNLASIDTDFDHKVFEYEN